ncbi:hypothetical protein ACFQ1L_20105 [Phytohabitans flavus]
MITNYIDGIRTQFNGSGGTVKTFRANGTFVHDYNRSAANTARVSGDNWRQLTRGTITGRLRSVGGKLIPSNTKASGENAWFKNGRRVDTIKMGADPTPSSYFCEAESLTEYTDDYHVDFKRQSG